MENLGRALPGIGHRNGIETKGPSSKPHLFSKPPSGHPGDLPAFRPGDGFQWMSVIPAGPGFDLHKSHDVPRRGDDIHLPAAMPDIPSEDGPPLADEVTDRRIFSSLPQRYVIHVALPWSCRPRGPQTGALTIERTWERKD